MTLIVAIQAADGQIAVAADGAATFATGSGRPTAKQAVSKLSVVEDELIFGHSGHVGLGQRLEPILADSWSKKNIAKKYSPTEAMQYLRNRFWQDVVKAEADVVNEAGATLAQLAQQFIMQTFLVAMPPVKDTDLPTLIHFSWNCFPERLTPDLPCVALGSGQPLADPFLSFVRRVIWGGKTPASLPDAIFSAAWTMRYAIESSPGFLSGPEQMMVLRKGNAEKPWYVEEIDRVNLDEHFQNVEELEAHIAEYPGIFRSE